MQTSLDLAELASEPNLRTCSRRFRLASVRGKIKGLTTVGLQTESGWYHGVHEAFVPGYDGMKAFLFFKLLKKPSRFILSRSNSSTEGPGSWRKGAYPFACERSERFKRSLVCTSSGFSFLSGFASRRVSAPWVGG